MKALIRLVHPFGESPHWVINPQPRTEAEWELRKTWPDDIRFEADVLNIMSQGADCTDWVITFARGKLKG